MSKKNNAKAWLVAVDMGYGHQRAAVPLIDLAYQGKIINANTYPGIPKVDRDIWREIREFYEFMSRFKQVPVVGDLAFELYDRLQEIPKFYPKRDLSKANLQLKQIYELFEDKNWGKHLIGRLEKKPLPLVTTFFVPAFMAEYFNYLGDIYLVVCDADISRTWAPIKPHRSKITYLVPNSRTVERLKLYGAKTEKIFLTGFPLPLENLGGPDLNILKNDFGQRLPNLDPQQKYMPKYEGTIKKHLGRKNFKKKSKHLLNLTFAIGGAGAQRELAVEIVKSLTKKIIKKKIRVNLIAGIHNDVNAYFKSEIRAMGLGGQINKGIKIIFSNTKVSYFKKFNKVLRTTDILWTKPSELSFYCALGLPIIMAPPIGSQEDFNKKWLRAIGAGIFQEDPRYTNEWLFDWLNTGWLAEAAMQGFLEAPKFGTYNIAKIVGKKVEEIREFRTVLQY